MKNNFGRPEPHKKTHVTTHTQICEGVVKMILKEISWEGRRRTDETGGLLSMW